MSKFGSLAVLIRVAACLFIIGGTSLAQPLVSQPEYHFLYAHYDNVVQLGGTQGMENMNFKVQNAEIKEEKENSCWIVRPKSEASEVVFSFYNKSDNTLLNELRYNVRKLPEPSLLYKIGASNLKVGYSPEFPFNAAKCNYTVVSWKVSIAGDQSAPIKGNGSSLSAAATSLIGRAPAGTKIDIEVKYDGPGIKNGFLKMSVDKEPSNAFNNNAEFDEFGNPIVITKDTIKQQVKQEGFVGLPEFNILYEQYDNIIQVGTMDEEVVNVSAEQATLRKLANNKYIVRPNPRSKEATVTVSTKTDNREYTFKVQRIPEPQIRISSLDKLSYDPENVKEMEMSIGYPLHVVLDVPYKITGWTIFYSSEEPPFKGTGNKLPSALIQKMKENKGERKITITCNYEGNGISNSTTAVFEY